MAGGALETASSSSEYLSSDASGHSHFIGYRASHSSDPHWTGPIAGAYQRHSRRKRARANDHNRYECSDHQHHDNMDQTRRRALPGVLFIGAVDPSHVRKRSSQLSRQRATPRKLRRLPELRTTCPPVALTGYHPQGLVVDGACVRPESSKTEDCAATFAKLTEIGSPVPVELSRDRSTDSVTNERSPSGSCQESARTGLEWESRDPIARGLRAEIDRVQEEQRSMIEHVRKMDQQIAKLREIATGRCW
jgi:hypothetical protein